MKKNLRIVIWALLFAVFSAILFPLIHAEDQVTPPEQLAPDEMGVYFIYHIYNFLWHGWLSCNENVIASLPAESYCYFKVKTSSNIINLYQLLPGLTTYLLRYQPGETIYLFYDGNEITQLVPYLGAEAVKEIKYVPLSNEAKPNEFYEFSVLNPGFTINDHMKKTDQLINPDADNAVITFIRTEGLIADEPFGIWSEAEYLGALRPHTFFQIKVKPGKHFFIGKLKKFSVLEADVAAGGKYYVELQTDYNSSNSISIRLTPVKKAVIDDPTLKQWLASAVPVTYDQNSVADDMTTFVDKAKVVIEDVLKKIEKHQIGTEKLLTDEARDIGN